MLTFIFWIFIGVLTQYIISNKYIIYNKIFNSINRHVNKYTDYKLVFIVNTELGMKKGKIISQCMHAYDEILRKINRSEYYTEIYKVWKRTGCAKIVLKSPQIGMDNLLSDLMRSRNINYATVFDAGRTQIKAGSNTVIAIGPAEVKEIDKMAGHFKLF